MEASTWPRAFVTLGLAGAAHVPTLSHLVEAAPVVAPLLVAGVRHPSRLRSAPPTTRAHDDPPWASPHLPPVCHPATRQFWFGALFCALTLSLALVVDTRATLSNDVDEERFMKTVRHVAKRRAQRRWRVAMAAFSFCRRLQNSIEQHGGSARGSAGSGSDSSPDFDRSAALGSARTPLTDQRLNRIGLQRVRSSRRVSYREVDQDDGPAGAAISRALDF